MKYLKLFENNKLTPKYILKNEGIQIIGSDLVDIREEIEEEELFDYEIVDRDDYIDKLIDWISESSGANRVMMKDDLKMLISLDDDYIFSSISTNDFIYSECSNFDETCEELLEINKNYLFNKETEKFNL
jgi:hypothetical protein